MKNNFNKLHGYIPSQLDLIMFYHCDKGAHALDQGATGLSPSPQNRESLSPLSSSHFQVKTIPEYMLQIYTLVPQSEGCEHSQKANAIWHSMTSR